MIATCVNIFVGYVSMFSFNDPPPRDSVANSNDFREGNIKIVATL